MCLFVLKYIAVKFLIKNEEGEEEAQSDNIIKEISITWLDDYYERFV